MSSEALVDSEGRIGFIDGIRAVASVAVLAQHLLQRVSPDVFSPVLVLGPGVYGVVLFFFVSGYVMPLTVTGSPTVAQFLLRRWFRIYPAYLLAFASAVVVMSGLGIRSMSSYSSAEVLANVFFVADYLGQDFVLGVAWTLPLEIVWYGLFALLFYGLGAGRSIGVAKLYLGSLVALAALSGLLDVRLPLGRGCMVGAAIVGYLAYEQAANRLDGRSFWRLAALFAAATASASIVSYGIHEHPTISASNALSAWTLAIASFYALVASAGLRRGRLLCSTPMRWLGRISYSLYLVHGIVLTVVVRLGFGYWSLLLVPPISLALSSLSNRIIEKPAISAGRRLEETIALRARPLSAVGR